MKRFLLHIILVVIVGSLISCTTTPHTDIKYLERQEIVDLISRDRDLILDHLNSLVSTPSGEKNKIYFDEIDLWFFPHLVLDRDGERHEVPLGSYHEPADNITWQQVDRVNYHKVDIASEDCSHCLFPIGIWLVFPNGEVVATGEQALDLEAELT